MPVNSQDFAVLPLKATILANLKTLGYSTMTPIQAMSLPKILQNRDVLAQAKTGSGKTAAFGLGVLAKIDATRPNTQAIIICPTRELADQVAKEMRRLARTIPNIKVLTLCGGTPIAPQAASLEHGAHCIVGTPGRIQDHLSRRNVYLMGIKTLVLDEADRMLDMGFTEELQYIVSKTPKSRQTLLFSATYPDHIQKLSQDFQRDPIEIKIDLEHNSSAIEQRSYKTTNEDKLDLTSTLLTHFHPQSTIIYCNTKMQCDVVADFLFAKGISATALHGDLEQRDRDLVLTLFSNRSISVLVATDVAARGLDIEDLHAVINFDLSRSADIHIHRIGRTGRAGKKGLALNLFTERDQAKINAIEELQGYDLKVFDPPDRSRKPKQALVPSMVSFRIAGGKKNKLRPGDILGALTKDSEISGSDIGKITIFDFYAIVAVKETIAQIAHNKMANAPIKGRTFKIKRF